MSATEQKRRGLTGDEIFRPKRVCGTPDRVSPVALNLFNGLQGSIPKPTHLVGPRTKRSKAEFNTQNRPIRLGRVRSAARL